MTLHARLNAKVLPEPNSGCWLWTGGMNSQGYGMIWCDGAMRLAHRISYMLHRGAIPDGAHVMHKCDTPACINPDHLLLGDHLSNMQDMFAKGRRRTAKRERSGKAKLTQEQVDFIRAQPSGGKDLADRFGIGLRWLCQLRAGKGWNT